MGSEASRGARLFGVAVGFVAVTLLQVYAFREAWPTAVLYAALFAVGAAAVVVAAERRRRA